MPTLSVQKSAWEALTEGKRATVLNSGQGTEVQLGEPVSFYVDGGGVEWLVWDDPRLAYEAIALVAAQMANPPLIVETTWETPGGARQPDRADVVSRLGTRYVAAERVEFVEGVDRLDAIVKTQKAANPANLGRVKAGYGVPEGWKIPVSSLETDV